MPLLGQLVSWLALLLAVWGVVTGLAGAQLDRPDLQESARRSTIALAGALGIAVLSLALALWRWDFHLWYVTAHADRTLATRDVWAALLDGWAGQWLAGGFVLAAGLAATRWSAAGRDPRALSYGTGIGSAMLVGVLMALLVAGRPFDALTFTPLDGQGLSQRLYDLDARLAAALRCVAYAATGVAAAWFAAARVARHRDAAWASWERTWISLAWALLSADLGLSLWTSWRGGSGAWMASALARPALPLWIVLAGVLHFRRAAVGVAAHIAHAGAVLVVVGLVATAFGTAAVVRLRPGESAPVANLGLTYLASSVYPARNQIITQGLVELRRGERPLGRVAAERRQQLSVFGQERFAQALRAGSWHGFTTGVRVNWSADSSVSEAAEFSVAVVPLASWFWLGWWLLVVGGVASLWRGPGRERP